MCTYKVNMNDELSLMDYKWQVGLIDAIAYVVCQTKPLIPLHQWLLRIFANVY